MITIFFDKFTKKPLYEQLYTQIKTMIQESKLKENEKLPSKRVLARHLEISQITVETAYSQLKAEGYIRSVEKSGYFVEPFTKLLGRIGKVPPTHSLIAKEEDSFLYDLRTSRIDEDTFPYDLFGKFARDSYLYAPRELTNDSDSLGLMQLREQIAHYLLEYRGIKTTPDQILIGSGSEQMLQMIVLLLGKEKHYVIETPGYPKSKKLYEAFGVPLDFVPLDESGMEMSILSQTNANVIHISPSHQFPSGVIMPIKRRMELLSWAYEKEDRYIIEDDYDSEFRFSGNPIPALKGLDQFHKVIYINSFSKSISPTLRVNFMVLPPMLLQKLHQEYSFFANPVPVHDQWALAKFLETKGFEKHLNRMRLTYKNKRDVLISLLKCSLFADSIELIGEEAGLHFTIKFKDDTDEVALIECAKFEKIKLYGMDEFRFTQHEHLKAQLVIGYGSYNEIDFNEIVRRLERAWIKCRILR